MGNEVAKKEPQSIKDLILSDKMKRQFAIALPKHLTPDRFVRLALTALNKTPKLAQCTQTSLLGCLMDLSQIGLEPDGRKAHLIPYGTECKLIVDYKGLVELVRNTGEVADIHADVVYENDKFEYSFGSDATLIHKPALKERGELIAAYSFVRLKDNSSSYEVMPITDIEAIKERSEAWKAYKKGLIKPPPWVTDWNEMAKKTVFKRHTKWLPLSSESSRLQAAIEKDYDAPIDMGPAIVSGKPQVTETLSKKELEAQNNAEPAQEESQPVISEAERAFKFQGLLKKFDEAQKALGDKAFFEILIANDVSAPDKMASFEQGEKILEQLQQKISDDFDNPEPKEEAKK